MTFPRIALGCGNFGGIGSAPAFFGQGLDEEAARAIMDAAWERGLRWFDTADAYGGGASEAQARPSLPLDSEPGGDAGGGERTPAQQRTR